MTKRPRRPGSALIGAAIAAVIAAAVMIARWGGDPDPEPAAAGSAVAAPARKMRPGPASAAPAAARAPGADDDAAPAALPGSLEGTEADGEVTADADGHLVVSLELRRLFDHFLSASGEEPLAAIRARIIAALRARLPATAAGEAIAILDRYLAYRDAARQLAPGADPVAGLDQVHDLRARMFTPDVAHAFFADEEAAIRNALARRAALVDPSLSADARARRLAELDAELPAAAREARAAATAPIDELQREQAMRAAGANDDQIAAARTAALGADAAARLAELDRSRATWDSRLAAFRAARAALLADPALDDAGRQQRIAALLESSFTPPERIRVEALDRIAAHAAGP